MQLACLHCGRVDKEEYFEDGECPSCGNYDTVIDFKTSIDYINMFKLRYRLEFLKLLDEIKEV